MFNYVLRAGEKMQINTPNVNSIDEIKKDITQTADCITNHSIYPDGLDITLKQFADHIEISSNRELIKNEDGTFTPKSI